MSAALFNDPALTVERLKVSRLALVIGTIIFLASGCFARSADPPIGAVPPAEKRVYLVHNHWHAAIVMPAQAIGVVQFPESAHFPGVEYLEISWGDADYFPAADAGVRLALKAAFWSSGSVLHVVGFNGPVQVSYPDAEIIAVELSDPEFQRLLAFVSAEFQRPLAGRPARPLPGLIRQSRFYLAKSDFSVFRNCNTWVAEAFAAAGLPVNPRFVFTAGSAAKRLKRLQDASVAAAP